jgi:hypothetical protein
MQEDNDDDDDKALSHTSTRRLRTRPPGFNDSYYVYCSATRQLQRAILDPRINYDSYDIIRN